MRDLPSQRRLCFAVSLVALSLVGTVFAQTPSILLEACNAMEPASRRLECLRAASGVQQGSASTYQGAAAPQTAYAAPRSVSAPAGVTSPTPRASGGQTCYTGPRGGTYTITASGRKNYSGC